MQPVEVPRAFPYATRRTRFRPLVHISFEAKNLRLQPWSRRYQEGGRIAVSAHNLDNRMAPYDNDLTSPTCAAPAGWYGEDFNIEIPKTGWYFFYGTLTDPATLADAIIGSQEELPKLRPARINGYETLLWGSRSALVKGESHAFVRGSAVKIETTTEARRLQGYATDAFRVESCQMRFEDEEEQDNIVDGQTLVWVGPPDELKPGKFDLREYQMNKLKGDVVKQN